jgi:carboxypeptidase Taq
MLRYEIERMMFDESADFDVDDLPRLWNEKVEEYLGIVPPNDTQGVLQDIHWSNGLMGYFPSYAIGSAYSAQLLAYMEREMDVYGLIRKGDFAAITEWLKRHIHQYGSVYTPEELVKKIAGEGLNAGYYIDYLTKKFG